MNDDAPTPPAELASAALDGQTTAGERATVDTDEALRDEMAFYAGLRDRMATVEVPAAARESAISAALAAFDELHAETATDLPAVPPAHAPRAARVVSLHQRRARHYRWLGGAVAAAVALVIAGGVLNGLGGSDEDSAANMSQSTEAAAVSAKAAAPSAAPGGPAESTQSTVAAESTPTEADAESATDGVGEPTGGPVDPWLDAPTLGSRSELLDFASFVAARSSETGLPQILAEDQAETNEDATAESTAESSVESSTESSVESGDTSDETTAATAVDLLRCFALYPTTAAAAFYDGRQVIVVDQADTGSVLVVDPFDCAVIDTVSR